MKIVNKPIKVMAIFNTYGKIEPVQFKLDDKVVRVEKVLKVYEDNFAGNKRIVFVCEHKEKYLYELKYEIDSGIWYLFKK